MMKHGTGQTVFFRERNVRKPLIGLMIYVLGTMPAWAFRTGTPIALSKQGEPVVIEIPIELLPGEELLSLAIAPDATYTTIKQPKPTALKNAKVTVTDSSGHPVMRIEGGTTDALKLALVLEFTTNHGLALRQLFADIPPATRAVPTSQPSASNSKSDQAQVASAIAANTAYALQMLQINKNIERLSQEMQRVNETLTQDYANKKLRETDAKRRNDELLEMLKPKESTDL